MVGGIGQLGPIGGAFVNNSDTIPTPPLLPNDPQIDLPDLNVEAAAGSNYFPGDLLEGASGFMMVLNWADFKRQSISDAATLKPFSGGTMYLPIPDSLTDAQGVTYSTSELGTAVGGVLNKSIPGEEDNFNLSDAAASAAVLGAVGAASGFISNLLGKVGITGKPTAAGLSLGGFAINPFMIVLLQAPKFRAFNFTWKLAPSNEAESASLKRMLNNVRNWMLPGLKGPGIGELLLTYPKVVTPEIKPDIGVYFKPMVVDNMIVNYAPAATPAFFKQSKQPAIIYLTLQLTEIELWMAGKYKASV